MSHSISAEALWLRLPELEWKLQSSNTIIHQSLLPRGLFLRQTESNPRLYIEEIRSDILALQQQTNERGAYYLAARVSQKINVLVRLCQLQARKKIPAPKVHFGVQAISTRQQWLQSIEEDVKRLTAQQEALTLALKNRGVKSTPQVLLNLQAELGEVEQQLTMANEALARGVGR